MSYLVDIRRFFYREFIPMTKGTIVVSITIFVLGLLLGIFGINLNSWLLLNPVNALVYPWTIITYPLVSDILSLIFAALWLWFVGGSLERTWGTKRYSLFVVLITAFTGIVMALVGIVFNLAIPINSFWIPLVGITWAWSDLYPDQEVLFWGFIPIKTRWLAWINAALIFMMYFQYHFLLGLASVSGILFVYLFQSYGPWGKGKERPTRLRRSRLRVIK